MSGAIDALGAWLARHDTTFDLVTVWAIVISLTVWAGSKVVALYALYGTRDRTAVGRSLKSAKGAELVMGCSLATLFGLSLIGFYAGIQFTIWQRLVLRLFLIVGTAGAAIAVFRFSVALIRERWRRPPPPGAVD